MDVSSLRRVWHTTRWKVKTYLRSFFVLHSGTDLKGRISARLASRGLSHFHEASRLAQIHSKGFVSPSAHLSHPSLNRGIHTYIGAGTVIYATRMSGHVSIDDHACLYGNTFVETGNSGMIHIGRHAHIQPGCHIHAHLSRIIIGDYCEIAPNCSFYCYNHGFKFDTNIMDQPLTSRGDIRIGNGCWLGQNVVVLENVIIGSGAVIAASSVVTKDIPPMAIAAGCPARVIGSRS